MILHSSADASFNYAVLRDYFKKSVLQLSFPAPNNKHGVVAVTGILKLLPEGPFRM